MMICDSIRTVIGYELWEYLVMANLPQTGSATIRKGPLVNERKMLFCREYIRDFNGARAARAMGVPKERAGDIAYKLLNDPDIVTTIGELLAGMHERARLTPEDIIKTLESMMTARRIDLMDDDGRFKNPHDLDEQTAAIIEGFKFKDGELVEIKTASKLQTIRYLGETMALFRQAIESKSATINANLDVKDCTPQEASQLYQELMKGGG